MGYSLSWLAVKGMTAEEVFRTIGAKKTGYLASYSSDDLSYLDMKNGWHLLCFGHQNIMNSEPSLLQKLSASADVISVSVFEGENISSAGGWKNGTRTWFVLHEFERGERHLETSGALPECFESVRNEITAEAESKNFNCDYFLDIPTIIGLRIVGFIHDRVVPGLDKGAFENLKRSRK
jgi:hypothetical protein